MKKIFVLFLIFSVNVLAVEISIAVAANVSYAIDALKEEFYKTNPNVKIRVTLGSSGKLTAQIKNGAPYGLFLSADMKYPQYLFEQKIAITKPVLYTQGALAYFSAKKRDFSKAIELLQSQSIGKIAIANPKTAPYGRATKEALENAKVYENLRSKFVYGESISQTVSYAVSATEIGIIAKSSLYSSKMLRYKEGQNWISLDRTLYTPIKQGVVLLQYSKNAKEYRAFYDFILSDRAKAIFKKYGYII